MSLLREVLTVAGVQISGKGGVYAVSSETVEAVDERLR